LADANEGSTRTYYKILPAKNNYKRKARFTCRNFLMKAGLPPPPKKDYLKKNVKNFWSIKILVVILRANTN